MTAPTLEAERAAPKLLPCPMCGGAAHLTKGAATENVWPHGEFHRVFCGACQLRQLFHRTAAEAIAAWNRRTAASVAEDVALPPKQSIDTPMLRQLMVDYRHAPSLGEQHMRMREVIAYIDGRIAETAFPEQRSIFEFKRLGDFTVQVTFKSARACGKFVERIAAAPSPLSPKEEAK